MPHFPPSTLGATGLSLVLLHLLLLLLLLQVPRLSAVARPWPTTNPLPAASTASWRGATAAAAAATAKQQQCISLAASQPHNALLFIALTFNNFTLFSVISRCFHPSTPPFVTSTRARLCDCDRKPPLGAVTMLSKLSMLRTFVRPSSMRLQPLWRRPNALRWNATKVSPLFGRTACIPPWKAPLSSGGSGRCCLQG